MRGRGSIIVVVLGLLAALILSACGPTDGLTEAQRQKLAELDQPFDPNQAKIPVIPAPGKKGDPKRSPTDPKNNPGKDNSKSKPSTALQSADLLVFSRESLSPDIIAKMTSLRGVVASAEFSLGIIYNGDQPITYAAVNPQTFRQFTPAGTAQSDETWQRIAAKQMAIHPDLGQLLVDDKGAIALGNTEDAPRVTVGSYAALTAPAPARKWLDAVIDESWREELHMPARNALLLSTGNNAVEPVQKQVRKLAGENVSIQTLAHVFDTKSVQTAVLTGTSLASAVGSFSYTANANGTINPNRSWVEANIRTQEVPILGKVTCHKVMLTQLKAALTEVVQRGLAGKIHRDQYGGCYYPRFIAHDPAKGLSFHSWGTAIDLNVPGNLRGTVGEIDRSVVQIFNKWGFNWGGTWRYTDPMHFELARIVKVG